MALHHRDLAPGVLATLRQGGVIPAHPLALNRRRALDPLRQRALSRYYIDAGASGLAVGVHTTQFADRDAGLYEPVLRLAAETAAAWSRPPAHDHRGLGRNHRPGAARGRHRARPRLPRGPAHVMPFKSQAQRRKFAELLVEGKISNKTFEEWNRETGGKKLPERVKSKSRPKRKKK